MTRATEPFVEVPTGEYSGWLFNPSVNTGSQVPVVWRTNLLLGQFFSGTRKGGSTSLSFQLGGALAGAIALEYNRIELPGAGREIRCHLAQQPDWLLVQPHPLHSVPHPIQYADGGFVGKPPVRAGSIRRGRVYSSSSTSGRVRGLRASQVAYSSGQSR